jgi:hypothetical protein
MTDDHRDAGLTAPATERDLRAPPDPLELARMVVLCGKSFPHGHVQNDATTAENSPPGQQQSEIMTDLPIAPNITAEAESETSLGPTVLHRSAAIGGILDTPTVVAPPARGESAAADEQPPVNAADAEQQWNNHVSGVQPFRRPFILSALAVMFSGVLALGAYRVLNQISAPSVARDARDAVVSVPESDVQRNQATQVEQAPQGQQATQGHQAAGSQSEPQQAPPAMSASSPELSPSSETEWVTDAEGPSAATGPVGRGGAAALDERWLSTEWPAAKPSINRPGGGSPARRRQSAGTR